MHQHQKDRMLTLRFDPYPFIDEFRKEIGVSPAGAAICLDIAFSNQRVMYCRRKPHYSDQPKRYRSTNYTYARIVPQVDYLARQGLIQSDRQRPGSVGQQSAMRATPLLLEIVAHIVKPGSVKSQLPRELIQLRPPKINGRSQPPIDYSDNRETHRMRQRVSAQNEAISSIALNPFFMGPLVRIFNENLQQGGRFFAQGGGWQNIKGSERRKIILNNEPVVEIDYKSIHPSILYLEAGLQVPSDCYDLSSWPRRLVKKALLIVINADTRSIAIRALAFSDEMHKFAAKQNMKTYAAAGLLIDDLKTFHSGISSSFHTGAWRRLMLIDSKIADEVMFLMRQKSIVTLPVHDSFLAPYSASFLLKDAMLQAAETVLGTSLNVEVKGEGLMHE